ncbi:hypothetical protein ACUT54_003306 [Vibrio cholerae]|nr:hypothetical protein [Vibrio cholerae]RGP86560.1 hypothetical protein BC354_13250 [Vibrio cholerae]RGP94324.1 hypothetical protein BC352_12905 [Vibrio cholerae]
MKKWDALGKVGSEAPLKETTDTKTKPKHLKSVPVAYFQKHEELKTNGGTSLDFTSYIIEALREKLERDGAL